MTVAQKDIIYIDVDDDITAIIGKVKATEHKIVALVPPKRTGILQSAVNMRLVQRAAEHSSKRLVLITNNQALSSLAAAASIAVAKNLQSKPEIPEIPALDVDDGDDIIDGALLPVGEHAKTAKANKKDDPVNKTVEEIAASDAAIGAAAIRAGADNSADDIVPKQKSKNRVKVPNFNTTRKRLVLLVIAGVLLLSFLIWAIFFAGSAKIVISARTTASGVSSKVNIGDDLATDAAKSTLKSVTNETKKDISIPINPTGKRDLGSKASGTVTLSHCDGFDDIVIPAGTAVSANGLNFMTANKVTVEPSDVRRGSCRHNVETNVTVNAQENGDKYNLGSQSYDVAGQSSMRARGSQMSGGTSKIVTVATEADIQAATAKADEQLSEEKIKGDLKNQFKNMLIIEQSFKPDKNEVKSSVAANTEIGDTKPVVAGTAKYSLTAVSRSEVNKLLDGILQKDIDKNNQRVYDNGSKKASLVNVNTAGGIITATISANGKIGPKIDQNKIKQSSKGKEFGDIQAQIEAIDGIDNVEVKFSPFWVNRVPDNDKRITVEFRVDES